MLQHNLDEARRVGESARRTAEEARRELARVAGEKQALQEQGIAASAELRRLRAQLPTLEAELTDHRDVLRLLGMRLEDEAHDPRSPTRRVASLAILRDLVASSSVSAAALVDDQGLSHLAVGAEPAVERIAYGAGVLAELLPVLEANLSQALTLFTLADARAAVHLLRPGDDRIALGVASSSGPPFSALRAAALRLRGRPSRGASFAELPGLAAEGPAQRDPGLDDLLAGWGRRRGVEGVSLLDGMGSVRATWGAVLPGATLLHAALRPLLTRALRDGVPLASVEVEARADRAVLAVRFVRDAPDSPCILVRSSGPLPPAELDELRATLRWHRPAPAASAAQGAP